MLADGEGAITDPYTQSIAVFRCVNVVGDALARAPLTVYEGEEPTGRTDPLQVLLDRPNHLQRQSQFVKTVVAHLLLDGNAFIYLGEPNSHRVPCELLPFPPGKIRPHREKNDLHSLDGYALRIGPSEEQFIPRDRVVHLQYAPNPSDPTVGVSPLSAARMSVDQDHLASAWNKTILKNSGSPAGILRFRGDGLFDDDDAELVRQRWQETYAGTEQAESIAVLGGDFEFQSIGSAAKDLQWLEGKRWHLADIARAFAVPLLFLNEYESSGLSDAGLKVQGELLYRQNVIPLGVDFTQSLTELLCLTTMSSKVIRCDWSQVEALRDDQAKKLEAAKALKELGYSRNEINAKLELGMADSDAGNVVLVPAGQTLLDDLIATGANDAAPAAPSADLLEPASSTGDGDEVDTVDSSGELTLNGAQLKAVIDTVTLVSAGELPYDSAKGILQVVFGFSPVEATAILGSVEPPGLPVVDAEAQPVAEQALLNAPAAVREKRAVKFRKLSRTELHERTGLVALALIFDRRIYADADSARAWIGERDFAMGEPQFTEETLRFASSEFALADFVDRSFRKATLADGVVSVLGRVKQDYVGDDGMWVLPRNRYDLWQRRIEPTKKPEEKIERHVKRQFNDWRSGVLKKLETETAKSGDPDPSSDDDAEGE